MRKKIYEKPCLKIEDVDIDAPLLQGSGKTAHTGDNSVVIDIHDQTTDGPVDAKNNFSVWDEDE